MERQIVVDFLNTLLELDPDFTKKLVDTRYECNKNLVNNAKYGFPVDENFNAGLVGVLNGLMFHIDGYFSDNVIAAKYDLDNNLIGFCILQANYYFPRNFT